jgi:hypothetical protein
MGPKISRAEKKLKKSKPKDIREKYFHSEPTIIFPKRKSAMFHLPAPN